MKLALLILFFSAVPASAMDWYVYASTDTSDGRNTYVVSTSTDDVYITFPHKTNFECGVTKETIHQLGFGLPPFHYRELQCLMKDKSIIATTITCLADGDDHDINELTIKNKKNLYNVSAQCLSTREDTGEEAK